MTQDSVRVVKVALLSNCAGSLFKLVSGLLTGSAALISEALHSLMGATNQALLYRNSNSGGQASGHIYSYGNGQTRYLVNLWASLGLFSIGAGIGLAWGIYRLVTVAQGEEVAAAATGTTVIDGMSLLAVFGALIIQGYSFFLAARMYRNAMQRHNVTNPFTYLRHCKDIILAVIVIQSVAGMAGLLLASVGIAVTLLSHNPMWDALAALLIAIVMGVAAFCLGFVYIRHITDVRDFDAERALEQLLDKRRSVHGYTRVHSVILEDNSTLLFAEIELTQEAMVSGMLKNIAAEKQALIRKLPADKKSDVKTMAFVTARSMVEVPLKRAGRIIADLEQDLREQLPQVAAVSIRVRGISPFELPALDEYKAPPSREAEYIGRE